MGEVDELDDAVHHRVAECDERIERTVPQSDESHGRELGRIVHKVDAEPRDDSEDDESTENVDRQCARVELSLGRIACHLHSTTR